MHLDRGAQIQGPQNFSIGVAFSPRLGSGFGGLRMPQEIGIGARIFVFLVYLGLGLSFLATTAILAHEFWNVGWLDFVTTDSHLFLFFPTLGIVALLAFYTPSCALTDLYWHHIPFGKLRFAIGLLLLGALSYLIAAELLASPKRSAWEIAPAALKEDKGEPPGCALIPGGTCQRLPILQALKNLRQVSQTHLGLAEFVRNCDRDVLLEGTPGPESKRFCFASTPLSPTPPLQSDADCCRAQERLTAAISTQVAHQERRSLTAKVHAWLLPLKVFFLLLLLAISVLLFENGAERTASPSTSQSSLPPRTLSNRRESR